MSIFLIKFFISTMMGTRPVLNMHSEAGLPVTMGKLFTLSGIQLLPLYKDHTKSIYFTKSLLRSVN